MAINGFTQVPNEVIEDSSLTIQARMVYIALLSKAWTSNTAFPGHKFLAEMMGVSTKTIGKYLKELRSVNLISWKRQGLNKTNLYTLNKWKSSGLEGKNLHFKKGSSLLLKKGNPIPINNTKNKKTKSEGDTTQFVGDSKFEDVFQGIFQECNPHLEQISYSTGVGVRDIRDVMKKMASHYVAEGKSFENWSAKLMSWVMKDLQDGKIERDVFLLLEAQHNAFGKV